MGKGTNRAEFFRGQVNKYGWCDMGSSFLPSEINAAFYGRNLNIWKKYRLNVNIYGIVIMID